MKWVWRETVVVLDNVSVKPHPELAIMPIDRSFWTGAPIWIKKSIKASSHRRDHLFGVERNDRISKLIELRRNFRFSVVFFIIPYPDDTLVQRAPISDDPIKKLIVSGALGKQYHDNLRPLYQRSEYTRPEVLGIGGCICKTCRRIPHLAPVTEKKMLQITESSIVPSNVEDEYLPICDVIHEEAVWSAQHGNCLMSQRNSFFVFLNFSEEAIKNLDRCLWVASTARFPIAIHIQL